MDQLIAVLNLLALIVSLLGTIIASTPKSQGKASLNKTMKLARVPLPWNPINFGLLCAIDKLFYTQRAISEADAGFPEFHKAVQELLLPYRTSHLEDPFPTNRFYITKHVHQGGEIMDMPYDTVVNAKGHYVDVAIHLEAELYNVVHSQKVRFGLRVVGVGFLLACIAQLLLMFTNR